MDDFRSNLFSTNNTKLNETTSTNKIYLSTTNTKWTIFGVIYLERITRNERFIYTRFTIYIVKFVLFVLRKIS